MSNTTFEEELARSGCLCYTVKGVSMLPLLHQQQDLVVIHPLAGRAEKYDVVLYKRPSGKYVLHRVIRVLPQGYVICGDNCIRREYDITDSEILGVMTEFVRRGRTISARQPAYRLYSQLWVSCYPVRAAVLWVIRLARRVPGKLRQIFKK